jgi:hypothetical protein
MSKDVYLTSECIQLTESRLAIASLFMDSQRCESIYFHLELGVTKPIWQACFRWC